MMSTREHNMAITPMHFVVPKKIFESSLNRLGCITMIMGAGINKTLKREPWRGHVGKCIFVDYLHGRERP